MPIALSRAAFSPREVARAADLWRAFQDIAVGGSAAAGYAPARYVEEKISFIVRRMVCVHHRETVHGEALTGSTWPSDFKRGMFFRRECRLHAGDDPVASVTQEWVHVSADVKLARASASVVASFPIEERDPSIEMPAWQPLDGEPRHHVQFECWQTWMDPLGHVNHPRYVDWAEEGVARVMAKAGLDPVRVRPVAESALYRAGVTAGETVEVQTQLVGVADAGGAVFSHEMSVGERRVARVRTVRELVGEAPGTLARALRSSDP